MYLGRKESLRAAWLEDISLHSSKYTQRGYNPEHLCEDHDAFKSDVSKKESLDT